MAKEPTPLNLGGELNLAGEVTVAKVKRIDKLTPEQEAAMAPYADEWIKKALKTGETDWATFEAAAE